jgi:amino acid adenylation domain-containing protein
MSDGSLRTHSPTNDGAERGAAGPVARPSPPIVPVRPGMPLPLSFAQERLWLAQRMDPASAAYNVPAAWRIRGPLDAAALERSLAEIVRRHEPLRTTISVEDGRRVQVVGPADGFALEREDLGELPPDARESRLAGRLEEEARRPFDLERGPVMRAILFRLDDGDHALLLCIHHVATDGWSMGVLLRELTALYEAFRRGLPSPLPALPVRYADYAAWERERLSGAAPADEVAWWKEHLAGAPTRLPLPADRARPAVRTHAGAQLRFELPEATVRGLRGLAQESGATLFMALHAGFAALLARWSGEERVVVGTPAANRSRREAEPLIGAFVNTLALATDVSGDPPFRAMLQRVRAASLGALAHRDLPFDRLVTELGVERTPAWHPVFQVMLALQNAPAGELRLHEANVERVPLSGTASRFDLTLSLEPAPGGGLVGTLEYASELFERATAERLARHFARLLNAAASSPDTPVSSLPLVDEDELRAVITDWNATDTDYPRDATIHRLFREVAAAAPNAPAIVCGTVRVTYGEMDARSDRIARALRGLGVAEGDTVAVAMERSPEAVAALLGVLKAGAAYVPLDPGDPAARLAGMMDDAACAALVVRREVPAALRGFGGPVLSIEPDAAVAGADAAPPLPLVSTGGGGSSAACVMFTSGSTGRPKGVAVPHRAVVRLVRNTNVADFGPGDVLLHASPLAFDASTLELWGALLNGGCVAVVPQRTPSLEDLGAAIRSHGVTRAWLTAGLFDQMVDARPEDLRGLRQLFTGGEALSVPHVRRAMAALPGVRITNGYGPTENATFTTVHDIADGDLDRPGIPIGRPVSNSRVYVLNAALRPCAVGVPGELCAAGDGLATGYVGRDAETAERFVTAEIEGRGAERVYRTGDRARWLPDGTLEFLGRMDDQVKLRGFRIEPGEVEAALRTHPSVRDAAVAAREGPAGGPRLVAYVVPAESSPSADELREHLRRSVPEHMVPAVFLTLDALPLTPSGKVDRRALPDPEPARRTSPEPPRSERERRIATVWAEVLGRNEVGVDDSFFELGGNSLLLAGLHERLRRALPEAAGLALVDLFRHPTVRLQAERLGEAAPDAAPSISRPEPSLRGEPIAVVGLAGRFPGAPNVDAFWRNLREGVESITFFSDEELRADGVPESALADPTYVRARGWLQGADLFDAGFFGFSPRDAEILDPQQRLFLETAWEALEHAGHAGERSGRPVGVFAGCSMSTYLLRLRGDPELVSLVGASALVLANDKDFLATRTAYKLGLEGPAVTVQSACSTSLVAVHLACRSLAAGECGLALAGGVSVVLPQKGGYLYQRGGVASPDGHCRAFDADGRGAVGGSGVGVVALRRLADAVAEGDTIHAVILGSAINNDGARKVGFTAPSVEGQARAVRDALRAAGVDPRTVGCVEAHGTATELGDPVEVAALAEAFGAGEPGSCALGSVKTNIGHLDAAAGVAGLIKAVLSLREGAIAPSLHFRAPNPQIDFARTPFFVNAALRPWTRGGTPRRAGVSSFGMGGTNAHAVLQEAPEPPPSSPSRQWQLLVLSARSATALEAATDRLAEHLRENPSLALAEVAFTLREGRRALPHRRALVVRAGEDAAALLEAREPGRVMDGTAPQGSRPVAFLFPGLGDQYPGMGRGLYESEPVFREAVDRCAALLLPRLGFDIRDILYPPSTEDSDASDRCSTTQPSSNGRAPGGVDLRRMLERDGAGEDEQAARLNRTEAAHPAVFVTGYALARLWESWGIVPEAVMGHSLGEYTAACVAGVLSLEDALELVAERARLVQSLPAGAMLAVSLSADEVLPFLGADVSIAAVNAPELCTLAGPTAAVEAVRSALLSAGHVARRLPTTHAFHSPMMRAAAAPLAALAARMALRPPRIPIVSNLTGTWMTAAEATDPAYWARHLCETVRFAHGAGELLREPGRLLLEVGPGQTLGAFMRQRPPEDGRPAPEVVPSLRHAYEDADDQAFALAALGRLWTAGAAPEWSALRAGESRRRVPLPTYPWEHTRCWLDPRPAAPSIPPSDPSSSPAKTGEVADWFYIPSWRRTLAPESSTSATPRRWLLLADDGGAADGIAERLREKGHTVDVARAGDAFCRTDDGWRVRPGDAGDLGALLRVLDEDRRAPDEVVHLWALPSADPAEASDDALARWGERGWHALRALAEALDARGGGRPVRVTVVASQTQGVDGGDAIVPEKALLLGALRVMAQEDAGLACRAVDVEPAPTDGAEAARRLDRVAAELAAVGAEPTVAWRGARRFAQEWERAPIRGAGAPARPLRERGVYLVTGGLGTVGLLVAGWMAREARARLVLTGRTPFPDRDAWNAWLANHGDDDATSRRIAAVRQMEAAGGEVWIAAMDVADEAGMRALLESVRARWGEVAGVVHAAGVVDEASLGRRLAALTAGDTEAQFRAKVAGTRVLERVLPTGIDFCFLVSSTSSVLGGPGFGAYAAANVFLDAVAAAHADERWVSVSWDGWPRRRRPEEGAPRPDAPVMTEAEAVEAFRRALGWGTVPHLVVAVADLGTRLRRWVAAAPPVQAQPADAPGSPRAALGIREPYVAPRGDLERQLERLWSRLLGVEGIGVHDDFFRLGGHSLLGTRLIGRVREEMGVDLPLRSVFNAPTVAKMAAEIAEARLQSADREVLERMLAEVRQLTPEQVRALLDAEDEAAGEVGAND